MNDYMLSIIHSDDYLEHHGVIGMKWGVRRYQPYGEGGYNPKNVNRRQARKGVRKAAEFQQDMNWHERNQKVKQLKMLKKTGQISSAEYRQQKREANRELKQKNKYTKSKDFAKEALSKATSNKAEGVYQEYGKKAYAGDPKYSAKVGLKAVNRILNANQTFKVAMSSIGGAISTAAVTANAAAAFAPVLASAGISAAALAMPIAALGAMAGTGAIMGVAAIDRGIRKAIINRTM